MCEGENGKNWNRNCGCIWEDVSGLYVDVSLTHLTEFLVCF